MKTIINNIKYSNRELKNIKVLVGASMLLALNLVLSFFNLEVTQSIRVSFSFISIYICAVMYGPVAAGAVAGLGDILKYMIKPTGPYFFGFTFNAILGGMIMGLFLYRTKINIYKVICARLCVVILVNLILNTLWLNMMYGKGFMVLLSARIVKSALVFPIEIVMLMAVTKMINIETNLKE